jgi:hypothetical protein
MFACFFRVFPAQLRRGQTAPIEVAKLGKVQLAAVVAVELGKVRLQHVRKLIPSHRDTQPREHLPELGLADAARSVRVGRRERLIHRLLLLGV